jgi:hypothetical protein
VKGENVLMRYIPEHRPEQNDDFPRVVHDTLEGEMKPVNGSLLLEGEDRLPWLVGDEFIGPCFNPNDAAVIAWALSNRRMLVDVYPELRALVDRCVNTPGSGIN